MAHNSTEIFLQVRPWKIQSLACFIELTQPSNDRSTIRSATFIREKRCVIFRWCAARSSCCKSFVRSRPRRSNADWMSEFTEQTTLIQLFVLCSAVAMFSSEEKQISFSQQEKTPLLFISLDKMTARQLEKGQCWQANICPSCSPSSCSQKKFKPERTVRAEERVWTQQSSCALPFAQIISMKVKWMLLELLLAKFAVRRASLLWSKKILVRRNVALATDDRYSSRRRFSSTPNGNNEPNHHKFFNNRLLSLWDEEKASSAHIQAQRIFPLLPQRRPWRSAAIDANLSMNARQNKASLSTRPADNDKMCTNCTGRPSHSSFDCRLVELFSNCKCAPVDRGTSFIGIRSKIN